MRKSMLPALLIVLLAAVALTLGACGSEEPESAEPKQAEVTARLEGSPPPLAAVHDQANELLGGGADAFEERLKQLEGYPIVVNKWASWCGPCRAEFPFLQKLALKHGRKVAFLGVNSNDNDAAAEDFLSRYPVTYPSYKDPDLQIAKVFKAVAAFPSTAFYDSKGELVSLKQGSYASEAKLEADIQRYAK